MHACIHKELDMPHVGNGDNIGGASHNDDVLPVDERDDNDGDVDVRVAGKHSRIYDRERL
jgi:hypothetical protein